MLRIRIRMFLSLPDPDPSVRGRIRLRLRLWIPLSSSKNSKIWIRTKMSRIRNTAYNLDEVTSKCFVTYSNSCYEMRLPWFFVFLFWLSNFLRKIYIIGYWKNKIKAAKSLWRVWLTFYLLLADLFPVLGIRIRWIPMIFGPSGSFRQRYGSGS